MFQRMSALFILLTMILSGCATAPKEMDENAPLSFLPATFSDLKDWNKDSLNAFFTAYEASCNRILKKSPDANFSADPAFGMYRSWQESCRAVLAGGPDTLKSNLEKQYKVVKATAGGNDTGLFTGYYESTLEGSRTRHGAYQHPLLARPSDLVMVDLGQFREALKGQRIAGRVVDGKLKPYESRADIVSGKLSQALYQPLVWLNDPHDAFFVQVQGSGIVHLEEGGIMRVGYDGQNGHAYYAIGRELVKRGVYKKEDVSMESIRRWMEQNPNEADDLMNTNPSYVFFRELPLEKMGGGPIGGEGVGLTAERSLAIDSSKIPYGVPVWIDITYNDAASTPIRRLMMTQDTVPSVVRCAGIISGAAVQRLKKWRAL